MGHVEGDFHGPGRRMVSAALCASGREVHDPGDDLPPEIFVNTVVETGARVIGVSAMMYTTDQNITLIRSILNDRYYFRRNHDRFSQALSKRGTNMGILTVSVVPSEINTS